MTARAGHGQFCPVAMASEMLCTPWTLLVLREMLVGLTRFNDIRRGVPRMSPSPLSKRLKELEQAGVIVQRPAPVGAQEYRLTPAGEDLRPLILGLGFWGQKWVNSELSLRNLDPSLLMWDMRRNLNPASLLPGRSTIQFRYRDLAASRRDWWLIVEHGGVDLCAIDPGHEIDILVTASLRSMTAVWMGLAELKREVAAGRVVIEGDPAIARRMQGWLGLSVFAGGTRHSR